MDGQHGSTSNVHLFTGSNGQLIRIIHVHKLNMLIVSDVANIGPHWIKVNVTNNVYTTKCLLGGQEELYCPVARFLVEKMVHKLHQSDQCSNDGGGGGHSSSIDRSFMINISLKCIDKHDLNGIAAMIQ